MYKEVKEQLHHSFDTAAPNLLSEILNAEIHQLASEEELFSELKEEEYAFHGKKAHRMYKYASIAAIFICVISLFFFQTQSVEGTVTVECTHSTKILINHAGKIVGAHSNDSSEKMVKLCKAIKGKELGEGLHKILKASKHNNKTVSIIYEGKKKTDENREVIRDVSDRFTKDSGTNIVSKEQSIGKAKQETVDVAQAHEKDSPVEEKTEDPVETTEEMVDSKEEPVTEEVGTETEEVLCEKITSEDDVTMEDVIVNEEMKEEELIKDENIKEEDTNQETTKEEICTEETSGIEESIDHSDATKTEDSSVEDLYQETISTEMIE
ncbi:MAG: hypothetical protein Q4E53_09195 [Eubacteriales bacterium]|nr:hypothetical protein [Eubacteriales bacterium]